MMTVKEYVKDHGIIETLKKIKEIGINYVELSQINITDQLLFDMQKALKEYDIKVISYSGIYEKFIHDQTGETFEDSFKTIVDRAHALGATYVRNAMMPRSCLKGKDQIIEVAKGLNYYGELLRKEGLKFYYHCHHFEFEKFDGKYMLDYFLDYSSPENLGIELDVHWAQRGGQDIGEWMDKLQGRNELLHLKDYRVVVPKGEGVGREIFDGCIEFAEIGEGNLDFKKIITKANETGVKYMAIEQDKTYGRQPFESLELSVANLKRMGFERNFK